MTNLYTPPFPPLHPQPLLKINDGKFALFGFCAASSLFGGDEGLLSHFILSKMVAL